MIIYFGTLRCQNVFRPYDNEKLEFSNSPGLKSVFVTFYMNSRPNSNQATVALPYVLMKSTFFLTIIFRILTFSLSLYPYTFLVEKMWKSKMANILKCETSFRGNVFFYWHVILPTVNKFKCSTHCIF